MSEHASEVFGLINNNPNITINELAERLEMSRSAVGVIAAELVKCGKVLAAIVPKEAGAMGPARRGFTANPAYRPPIPETWDVLAHFFGRIAEPELEAA